ncbi:MAG: hypothetical protein H7246_10605 [Phycisphaerae bacterium]|nr:hypothetical protein [Saprospiraceae bacterium]
MTPTIPAPPVPKSQAARAPAIPKPQDNRAAITNKPPPAPLRKGRRPDPPESRDPIQPPGELVRLIDYLAKMLPRDHKSVPVPLELLKPDQIKGLMHEALANALLDHINGANLRIRIPKGPISILFLEGIERQDEFFQFTDHNTLEMRIHPALKNNPEAFACIAALEFSRVILDHNDLKYSLHHDDNARLPELALHVWGFSDLFLEGYESAKAVWGEVAQRPLFSQLRYEQHRSAANYIDDLDLNVAAKNPAFMLSENEMASQILIYYQKSAQLMDKEFNRYQRDHPHFTTKDIYEKMLYDLKRDFKL